ncbi:MAG: hypothetical protein HYZ26_02235 [Chloroflexi bacterium]|nr:hypothetical protein [Chloroflexota bacterium]
MLRGIISRFAGDPSKRALTEFGETVEAVNALEPAFEALSDEALRARTPEFKQRLEDGETLDDLLPEAFAAVREASKRTIGLRHFDVQLIGGIVLHEGRIAEMRTGEGKTLVATLPLYLNALTGKGTHLVTVNDYLARRDARWMAPIYDFLGLSVGVLQMGSRTENGRKAFLIDLNREHQQEDQHQLALVERAEAYNADITYGTNSEFGFDYLRDNMTLNRNARVQRGHHYAIIDEVDNVLIDEARTPLIISGPSHDDAENYEKMAVVVKRLQMEDVEVSEKDRTVVLTELGEAKVEQGLGVALRDPERPEDVTPEQARLMGYLQQALKAQFLFKRNKDYLVQGGQVIIIDEFTGRLMPGRRWSDGLHQAVEAKEGVKVQAENVTHATITIQNYFRMYEKLAGMTGTALTEAEEFEKIYKLDVMAIAPHVEYLANQPESDLEALKARDEYGYEYHYYARLDDPDRLPALWKRKDYPDVVYRTEEAKLRAIVAEIIQMHVIGRPVLVGTTSVENSERLSNRLKAEMVRRLLEVLLVRDTWLEKNGRADDGRAIPELAFLNEPLEKVNVAQMRQAGKALELPATLEHPENISRLLNVLRLGAEHKERLQETLKRGISQQVLNARKHTEESQIIAGAGAFGAVTIATNMAGRGVDIKLGGEMAEEVVAAVNRVLRKAGAEDPFSMTMEDRLAALKRLSPQDYGIYASEVGLFLRSMDEMEKVKELGGLHVVGSERHEARRIDNQLRGRAARQGDPGSSRFFLSLQDELMRLFGGQQVEGLMLRLGMDDAIPLEHGIVSRVVEQSQTRVEGANFDSRKHLLEYDDVLNSQRATVYAQRDTIFLKDDLSADVRDMLQVEVARRVPENLAEEEGPWKLLAWLEQIQPTMLAGALAFPSFTYRLLLDELRAAGAGERSQSRAALLGLAETALAAEEEHVVRSAEDLLAQNEQRLEAMLDERQETLDTFIEALRYADETDTRPARELLAEAESLLHLPLKLDGPEQRLLREEPARAAGLLEDQVERALTSQMIARVVTAVERRINQPLELDAAELSGREWDEVAEAVLGATQAVFASRRSQLLGENGQLARDLDARLNAMPDQLHDQHLMQLLLALPQGELLAFDRKTHRQVRLRTIRLSYIYHAARLLEDADGEDLAERALEHLEGALDTLTQLYGLNAWEQMKASPLAMLRRSARARLAERLGEAEFARIKGQPMADLPADVQKMAIEELGRQGITETYRGLILRVISELWIEYLTEMEALRVSIGLEAYGQRDPLVEYKARASQMFARLFEDMRASVVNHMFTAFQARPSAPAPQAPASQAAASLPAGQAAAADGDEIEGGKRKRRRRRRK